MEQILSLQLIFLLLAPNSSDLNIDSVDLDRTIMTFVEFAV